MTNHWIDIKNADAVLYYGQQCRGTSSRMFQMGDEGKDNGACIMHVDPKFSRTSARAAIFMCPFARARTYIAFLGGMINYILNTGTWFADYVLNYTKRLLHCGEGYSFSTTGFFSGYDPARRACYDRKKWDFERGPDGEPLQDMSLRGTSAACSICSKSTIPAYTLDKVSYLPLPAFAGNAAQGLQNVLRYRQAGQGGNNPVCPWAGRSTRSARKISALPAIIQLLLGNIRQCRRRHQRPARRTPMSRARQTMPCSA